MTPTHSAGHLHTVESIPDTAHRLARIQEALATRILGKPREIRLALACVLAEGHLLIEDVPGVGKTTLAQGLAQVLGLTFSRIQFVSDLLPADILGVSLFDRNAATFHFAPGPIFSQLVLADEINRSSPRTQSALLEAMAERQVTIEGETRALARPFTVIATQNPGDHSGTFALPDSQLDRFLMRIGIGYPPSSAERQLLTHGHDRTRPLDALADTDTLIGWQQAVARIETRDAVVDYVLRLIRASRNDSAFAQGLSPRAGLALRRSAQAWALLCGRDYVLPEDVQAVLPAVVDHRLTPTDTDQTAASTRLLADVDVI